MSSKSRYIRMLLMGALCCAMSASFAQDDALKRISWLAGCWANEKGEAGSVEHWMPPAAEMMLGMARTVKGGKVIEYEFMQIRQDPGGRLAYYALPSEQKATMFMQLRLSDNEVVFENSDHDFPQRVIYRRSGEQLLASIEGTSKGVQRSVEFPMRRTSCDK